MDLNKFRKVLGVALSNTSIVQDAFKYVCYIPAARVIATEVLIEVLIERIPEPERFYKKITNAIHYRRPLHLIINAIDAIFPFKAAIEKESKAYICRSTEEGNLLAGKSLRDAPLAQPNENAGVVMAEWLLSALTFAERQVLLLLRFPGATRASVAEDLGLSEVEIRRLYNSANGKIDKRKGATTWKAVNPEDTFTGDVSPGGDVSSGGETWEKFYESFWSRSVEEFAYHLLGDHVAARRIIADKVKALSKRYIEDETFDITRAWEGNENGWPGFKKLTFTASKEFLKTFNKVDKRYAKPKPEDVWASRIKERLSPTETQCFLLSTLFFPRDSEGIFQISKLVDLNEPSVENHLTRAIRKMLDRDWRTIE